MMKTKEEIYQYTGEKLQANYENVPKFNAEVLGTFEYYKNRLLIRIDSEYYNSIEELFFDAIKSQIFNGYFIGLEFINTYDLENEWLANSEGVIASQIPDLLRKITNSNIENIITIDPMKSLISQLIMKYEDIYDFILDVSFNTACLGMKWSLLDEAKKRGIIHSKPTTNGILAKLDEFTYLNTETFLDSVLSDKNYEMWNIIKSGHKELEKIGEISVIKFLNINKEAYYVNIAIRNDFTVSEQQQLMEQVINQLKMMNNSIERENIVLSAHSVEDFFIIDNPIQL